MAHERYLDCRFLQILTVVAAHFCLHYDVATAALKT